MNKEVENNGNMILNRQQWKQQQSNKTKYPKLHSVCRCVFNLEAPPGLTFDNPGITLRRIYPRTINSVGNHEYYVFTKFD